MADNKGASRRDAPSSSSIEISVISSSSTTEVYDVVDHATTVEDDPKPYDVFRQIQRCGSFQIILSFILQSTKLVVAWSVSTNSFFAFVPKWRCADIPSAQINTSGIWTDAILNASDEKWNERCYLPTGEKCQQFEFENSIHTIVSEFDLVCDKSWVTATIFSVQMFGMMVGSFFVGHLTDTYGRKKPFVLSLAVICASHIICYLSINWIMFGVGRFFAGVGSSIFMCVESIIIGEYSPTKWRAAAITFPSWSLALCLFTLVAWLLHDWKWVTLIIVIGSFCFLASWFFIPESVRWLFIRERFKEAHKIIVKLEKWSKNSPPEFNEIIDAFSMNPISKVKKYSMLILFRNKSLLKTTILLIPCWLGYGLISHGVTFGMKKFSGDIYLNLFLYSILLAPSRMISIFLQNVIGRKLSNVLVFFICMVGGFVAGIVQYTDSPQKGELINGFALAAGVSIETAWSCLITFTVELYPTIARTTGCGFQHIFAWLGAVIAPQIVYLEDFVPGILYFTMSVVASISLSCMYFLPETMDKHLVDSLSVDKETSDEKTT